MQPPSDDEGVTHFQRLRPDEFDVVLSTYPTRLAENFRPGLGPGVWATLIAVLGVGAYAIGTAVMPASPRPVAVAVTAPVAPAVVAAAVVDDRPVIRPAAQPVISTYTDPSPVQLPEPAQAARQVNATPSSMVSASYMEQYRTELKRGVPVKGRPFQIATVSIREWDGRNAYRAQWRIMDNQIDNASVCTNFLEGSVERRECRKSAAVYFREQCRDWTQRAQQHPDEQSRATKTRYCTATTSFDAAQR